MDTISLQLKFHVSYIIFRQESEKSGQSSIYIM